jgi:5-methylcytosine-specific restriction endonuclease McrA
MPRQRLQISPKLNRRINGQVHNGKVRATYEGVESTLTVDEWRNMLLESNGICRLCSMQVGYEQLYLDHIYPMMAGGAHTKENVQPVCYTCNRKKAHSLPDGTRPKLRMVTYEEIRKARAGLLD